MRQPPGLPGAGVVLDKELVLHKEAVLNHFKFEVGLALVWRAGRELVSTFWPLAARTWVELQAVALSARQLHFSRGPRRSRRRAAAARKLVAGGPIEALFVTEVFKSRCIE